MLDKAKPEPKLEPFRADLMARCQYRWNNFPCEADVAVWIPQTGYRATGHIGKSGFEAIPLTIKDTIKKDGAKATLKNTTLKIYYWNTEAYVQIIYYGNPVIEMNDTNATRPYIPVALTFDENQVKGRINITHSGEVRKGKSNFTLSITTTGRVKWPVLCTKKSAGVARMFLPDIQLECSQRWRNWTEYYPKNKTYAWTRPGEWYCPDMLDQDVEGTIRPCRTVDGELCTVFPSPIPKRLQGKVDSCYYLGPDLDRKSDKQTKVIPVSVTTASYLTDFEYLRFYLVDHDKAVEGPLSEKSTSQYVVEGPNGEDVGHKDVAYEIEVPRS